MDVVSRKDAVRLASLSLREAAEPASRVAALISRGDTILGMETETLVALKLITESDKFDGLFFGGGAVDSFAFLREAATAIKTVEQFAEELQRLNSDQSRIASEFSRNIHQLIRERLEFVVNVDLL